MMRSAFDMVSAWASVLATTNSTPWSPAVIMLLTALPPAPPTPNTVMRGFSSRMSGICRLIVMVASRLRARREGGRAVLRRCPIGECEGDEVAHGGSEPLAQPSTDAAEIAVGPGRRAARRVRVGEF